MFGMLVTLAAGMALRRLRPNEAKRFNSEVRRRIFGVLIQAMVNSGE